MVQFFIAMMLLRKYSKDITRGGGRNLSKQNEIINEELAELNKGNVSTEERSVSKKVFVEPAISVPVDVLEATTFFQIATSGTTN
ncbi:MAG TPA: hypothetical protein VJW17_12575 [Pyrinomonadaceae bacterium]|jgi:hypothetical protein|nr:hypothetical protein [Pyrinomonadaceae bacterium]